MRTTFILFGVWLTTAGASTRLRQSSAAPKMAMAPLQYKKKNTQAASTSGFSQKKDEEKENLSTTIFKFKECDMMKYYDSPINKIAVTISVPVKIVGKQDMFMTLQGVMPDDGSRTMVGGSCNASLASLRRRSTPAPPAEKYRRETHPLSILDSHFPIAQVKTLTLDCSGAECKTFTCQMGPFAQGNNLAKIELSMIVNVTRIMEQVGTPGTIDIISEGSLTILDDTEFTHYGKQQPKEAMIMTSLVKEGPPGSYSMPWWVYLLIVLGGLLVLAAIIAVLYKCGFFRRKEKEDLERERESLAASSAANSPTTEDLPSIPSDDSEVRMSLLNADSNAHDKPHYSGLQS